MTDKEIEDLIEKYIDHSQEDLSKEHPKFDFKYLWYELKKPEGINELVKDCCAMVNTVGLDGFIVIGYDNNKKKFSDAKFGDSGLRDVSEITGIIIKNTDPAFEVIVRDIKVKDHSFSVIHIPKSIDKPHFMKCLKRFKEGREPYPEDQRILVRINSQVHPASRYHLDFMLYDRKNILPDYEIRISFDPTSLNFIHNNYKKLRVNFPLTIENTGYRPVSIKEIKLKFAVGFRFDSDHPLTIRTSDYLHQNKINIPANNIYNTTLVFYSIDDLISETKETVENLIEELEVNRKYIKDIAATIVLSNGKTIQGKIDQH